MRLQLPEFGTCIAPAQIAGFTANIGENKVIQEAKG
jgi:hypothetical protein